MDRTLVTSEKLALPDEQVVTRVRAGETALFEVIMRRYNQRLFRVARAIVRSDSEAEDVVQQAYLSAYTHLHQFAGHAQLSTWLTRIVINEASGRARLLLRLGEMDGEEHRMNNLQAKTPTPEEEMSSKELTRLLESALDAVPEIYRVVFMMREVQGMSTAETATCLDLTEDAVKVRLHRARGLIQKSMLSKMDASAAEAFSFLGERCDRMVQVVMTRLDPVYRPFTS